MAKRTVKLQTPYDRVREPDEKFANDGVTNVNLIGYVPANIQIERMIENGERLRLAKADLYDYHPERDEQLVFEEDPTRRGNYDMADAQADLEGIRDEVVSGSERVADTGTAGEDAATGAPDATEPDVVGEPTGSGA